MPIVCHWHWMIYSTRWTCDQLMYPNMTNPNRLDLRHIIWLCYRSWPTLKFPIPDAIPPFSHLANAHSKRPHIQIHHHQLLPISRPICHDCMWPINCRTVTMPHSSLHSHVPPMWHCIQIHPTFYPKWRWSHQNWPTPAIYHSKTMPHCVLFVYDHRIILFLSPICCYCPATRCESFYLRRICFWAREKLSTVLALVIDLEISNGLHTLQQLYWLDSMLHPTRDLCVPLKFVTLPVLASFINENYLI